jgi:hypothetical protein
MLAPLNDRCSITVHSIGRQNFMNSLHLTSTCNLKIGEQEDIANQVGYTRVVPDLDAHSILSSLNIS